MPSGFWLSRPLCLYCDSWTSCERRLVIFVQSFSGCPHPLRVQALGEKIPSQKQAKEEQGHCQWNSWRLKNSQTWIWVLVLPSVIKLLRECYPNLQYFSTFLICEMGIQISLPLLLSSGLAQGHLSVHMAVMMAFCLLPHHPASGEARRAEGKTLATFDLGFSGGGGTHLRRGRAYFLDCFLRNSVSGGLKNPKEGLGILLSWLNACPADTDPWA